MEYFSLLGNVEYENKQLSNIFKRYIIENTIDEKFLKSYSIKENQTLENISYEEYGDEKYWWLIALLNDIKDALYDIPLPENILQKAAKENSYDPEATEEENMLEYIRVYDILSEENDQKRNIKIIKSEYIADVITSILRDETLVS